MDYIRELISLYYVEIVMGLAIGMIILLVLFSINLRKHAKAKERYNSFMRGLRGVNIEDLLIYIDRDIKSLERDINLIENNIEDLVTRVSFTIQKIGFYRYNAFSDMGSSLSFSIALLDNFNNGFILTSIYGRESSVSYAKPLKNGVCSIPLSAEEMLAIDRAIKGESIEMSF